MPRKALPHCKVPGCTNPRHPYPNGTSASFCDGTNNSANDCASRCDCEAAHHWDRRQSGLKSG